MQLNIKLFLIFVLITKLCFSQFQKTDSIGNFYVMKGHFLWQKSFVLNDVNELDEQLKSNYFSSKLDILKFTTSSMSNKSVLIGDNLPQYALGSFEAFIVVDIINDKYRITIKDIVFPKFVETWYYNGRKEYSGRGTLDYYLLRRDGVIKRNSGTLNVLHVLDNAFLEIFTPKY